jgi:hypothetical protein
MSTTTDSFLSAPGSTPADPVASHIGDPPARRRDWQAITLFLGGVVFAVGNLLHPLEHDDAAYHATTWQAAHLIIFASLPLLVVGMPALYRYLAGRVGHRLTVFAVVATVVGLIGIGPGAIIETFVAPMIGHEAMEHLEAGGMAVVDGIFGIAFLSGTLALGWAVYRAGVRPRWSGPTIMAGAVVLLAVMNATGRAAGVAIITATVLYGLALAALATHCARSVRHRGA